MGTRKNLARQAQAEKRKKKQMAKTNDPPVSKKPPDVGGKLPEPTPIPFPERPNSMDQETALFIEGAVHASHKIAMGAINELREDNKAGFAGIRELLDKMSAEQKATKTELLGAQAKAEKPKAAAEKVKEDESEAAKEMTKIERQKQKELDEAKAKKAKRAYARELESLGLIVAKVGAEELKVARKTVETYSSQLETLALAAVSDDAEESQEARKKLSAYEEARKVISEHQKNAALMTQTELVSNVGGVKYAAWTLAGLTLGGLSAFFVPGVVPAGVAMMALGGGVTGGVMSWVSSVWQNAKDDVADE